MHVKKSVSMLFLFYFFGTYIEDSKILRAPTTKHAIDGNRHANFILRNVLERLVRVLTSISIKVYFSGTQFHT